MSWAMPNPDDRVEWELWTSSNDGLMQSFKESFKETISALGDSQLFAPHYIVLNGSGFDFDPSECTNGGRCVSRETSSPSAAALRGARRS